MGWGINAGFSADIDGIDIKEMCKNDDFFSTLENCINYLNNNCLEMPKNIRKPLFLKELQYYSSFTNNNILDYYNTLDLIFDEDEFISHPSEALQITVLMSCLSTYLPESKIVIWLGDSDYCAIDIDFMNGVMTRFNRELYIETGMTEKEAIEEATGTAFVCTKEEIEDFFSCSIVERLKQSKLKDRPIEAINLRAKKKVTKQQKDLIFLKRAEWNLEECSADLRDNEKIVIAAVTKWGGNFQYASERLKNDRNLVIRLSEYDSLQYASESLRHNRNVVLKVVRRSSSAFRYASDEFRSDRKFVLNVINNTKSGNFLKYVSNELKNDRQIVLKAVSKNGNDLEYAPTQFQSDREIVAKAVTTNGSALKYASEALKNDKELVLLAIQQYGEAFKYASDSLKNDRNFVLQVVQESGEAYSILSDKLKIDREIILLAAGNNCEVLGDVPERFKNDKEIVIKAVQGKPPKHSSHNDSLRLASKRLRNDKDVVLEAVKNYSRQITYASKKLKGDRDIAFELVKKDGYNLTYVSNKLKDDNEIVFAALSNNYRALEYASKRLNRLLDPILEPDFNESDFNEWFGGTRLDYIQFRLKSDIKEQTEIAKVFFGDPDGSYHHNEQMPLTATILEINEIAKKVNKIFNTECNIDITFSDLENLIDFRVKNLDNGGCQFFLKFSFVELFENIKARYTPKESKHIFKSIECKLLGELRIEGEVIKNIFDVNEVVVQVDEWEDINDQLIIYWAESEFGWLNIELYHSEITESISLLSLNEQAKKFSGLLEKITNRINKKIKP